MSVREFTPEELEVLPDVTDPHEIATRIAASYGLTVEELRAPGRTRPGPAARAELARRLRVLGWSFPRIGRFINRDHTTVVYALAPTAKREARKLERKIYDGMRH